MCNLAYGSNLGTEIAYLFKDPITMKKRNLPAIVFCTLIVFSACRPETAEPLSRDYSSASDNALAENAFNDILLQVENAVEENGLRDLCSPTVSFDTSATPRTITLDFGDVNCTALNGRTRRGRIQVSYTGRYRDVGTEIIITPEDYHVNNIHVQGTKTVRNTGPDANGHPAFDISVNGTLTADDGTWTAAHVAQRTRTWVTGSETMDPFDDAYLISGVGSGVNRNGVSYTVSIESPLRVQVDCPWIMQGSLRITPSERPVVLIDYGNGACDRDFSVTVNGMTFNLIFG